MSSPKPRISKRQASVLLFEFSALCFFIPMMLSFLPVRGTLFAVLWLLALSCYALMRKQSPEITRAMMWDGAALRDKALWRPILRRFVFAAVGLVALTFWLVPERWLAFPSERPHLWLMVMVLYPWISVLPQEFFYRTYFFHRYAPLFGERWLLFASAFTFGFSHIVFHNWVAVLLCLVGGTYFADTYRKRPSLALVMAEHALYGCFIFTIGLGWYFFSGAPHKW